MRNRREVAALIFTALIAVLVLLGFYYFELPEQRLGDVAPEQHNVKEDTPEEVQDPPPSAVGDIDEP
ncbi:hypothetical protein [Nitratireductor sp. ZSWI3]|uniref:hypothetical protein n=1 Tax=Nitratireductor sp. ZSWI3 TaxID=2966359 RepID=UPI00214FFBAB|nr:hypothetical protein [Nitratireductor sp. ZSWI3]MCR4264701.1 hypothetical protein [Nitratireductor sp. ZSWI3]